MPTKLENVIGKFTTEDKTNLQTYIEEINARILELEGKLVKAKQERELAIRIMGFIN